MSTRLDVLLGCFGYCIARLRLILYTICRHITFREPLGVVANIIYRIERPWVDTDHLSRAKDLEICSELVEHEGSVGTQCVLTI